METKPGAVDAAGETVERLLRYLRCTIHGFGGRLPVGPIGGVLTIWLFSFIFTLSDLLTLVVVDIPTNFKVEVGFGGGCRRCSAICRRMRLPWGSVGIWRGLERL